MIVANLASIWPMAGLSFPTASAHGSASNNMCKPRTRTSSDSGPALPYRPDNPDRKEKSSVAGSRER